MSRERWRAGFVAPVRRRTKDGMTRRGRFIAREGGYGQRLTRSKRAVKVVLENHTPTISLRRQDAPPIRPPSQTTVPGVEPSLGFVDRGDAMWIVFYIATIASLSALGLAPNFLPDETDEEPDA